MTPDSHHQEPHTLLGLTDTLKKNVTQLLCTICYLKSTYVVHLMAKSVDCEKQKLK